MMKLSEASKKFYFTTKIELDDEGNFVELREPTMAEAAKMSESDNQQKQIAELESVASKCIVDSSFTDEDGNKAKGEDVMNFIKQHISIETEIIEVWKNSFTFRLPKDKK
jgi:hypothetical protein